MLTVLSLCMGLLTCDDIRLSYDEGNCCPTATGAPSPRCPNGCITAPTPPTCTYTANITVAPGNVVALGTVLKPYDCTLLPVTPFLNSNVPTYSFSSDEYNIVEFRNKWDVFQALMYAHEVIRYVLHVIDSGISVVTATPSDDKFEALGHIAFFLRWSSHLHSYAEDTVLGKAVSLSNGITLPAMPAYADDAYAPEHVEILAQLDEVIALINLKTNVTQLRDAFALTRQTYHTHMANEESSFESDRMNSAYADPLFFNALGGAMVQADIAQGTLEFMQQDISFEAGVTHLGDQVYLSFYMGFLALMTNLMTLMLGENRAEQAWANLAMLPADPPEPNTLLQMMTSSTEHAEYWIVRHLNTLFR